MALQVSSPVGYSTFTFESNSDAYLIAMVCVNAGTSFYYEPYPNSEAVIYVNTDAVPRLIKHCDVMGLRHRVTEVEPS